MTVEIPLSSKKYPGLGALVDDQDAELVAGYSWSPHREERTFYARAAVPGMDRHISMHRLITGAGPGEEVDHENHDGLDNRRENLRVGSKAHNQQDSRAARSSSSRYKGVHREIPRSVQEGGNGGRPKWSAQIRVDGKLCRLGNYDEEIEAAMVYDYAARQAWGEHAFLNFPHAMATN